MAMAQWYISELDEQHGKGCATKVQGAANGLMQFVERPENATLKVRLIEAINHKGGGLAAQAALFNPLMDEIEILIDAQRWLTDTHGVEFETFWHYAISEAFTEWLRLYWDRAAALRNLPPERD